MFARGFIAIGFVLINLSAASADVTWNCTSELVGGTDSKVPIMLVESGNTLFGYFDDYSGRPTTYEIVENSGEGLVATSQINPTSGRQDMRLQIALNKRTGEFRMTGVKMGTHYEEAYAGICKRHSAQ